MKEGESAFELQNQGSEGTYYRYFAVLKTDYDLRNSSMRKFLCMHGVFSWVGKISVGDELFTIFYCMQYSMYILFSWNKYTQQTNK